MHLLPCFAFATTHFSPIYGFICMAPSHREEGGGWRNAQQQERTYLVLLSMAEKENEHTCELLLCSPTKLSLLQALAPLHPVTQTHRPWELQGWAAFTSSNRQVEQSPCSLHPPAQQPPGKSDALAKSRAPGQARDPSTSVQLCCHQLTASYT